jgi:hypothetical protein
MVWVLGCYGALFTGRSPLPHLTARVAGTGGSVPTLTC